MASSNRKKRSAAAKKGWATRRKRERSVAAKKGWATRRKRERFIAAKKSSKSKVTKVTRQHVTKVTKGEVYQAERKRLRKILGYNPSPQQIERAVKLTKPSIPPKATKPPKAKKSKKPKKVESFDEVMDRVIAAGVLNYQLFEEIAARFNIPLHDVYNVFFGYPPTVGIKMAA